jgi:molecular chaperone GrpE (heat shock protein)
MLPPFARVGTGGDPAVETLRNAIFAAIDGIDAAIETGMMQIARLDAANTLFEYDAQRILEGWLGGQNIIRQRLLDALEREGITPTAIVGQRYDNHLHKAVGMIPADAAHPAGTIAAVRRRGYAGHNGRMRIAEVVVATASETR